MGSIPRTPSIVFSRIGKTQKKAMNETFWTLPIECRSTTEIGSSAGGGIARQNSMCGIAASRPQRERPSGIPSAMPDHDRDPEAEHDPLEARHDVRAELREEPQVAELDEDRRQAREVLRLGMDGPGLPADQQGDRDRDLGRDLERRRGPDAHSTLRCDGCQRNARRSTPVMARWIATPRKPVASA